VSTLGSEAEWEKQKAGGKLHRLSARTRARTRFVDAVFGAITLSFDDHRLGVMEEAVQDAEVRVASLLKMRASVCRSDWW